MKIHTLWGWQRHDPLPALLESMDEASGAVRLADVTAWEEHVAVRTRYWVEGHGFFDLFERTIDVADKALIEGSTATTIGAVVGNTTRPALPGDCVLTPDGVVVDA